MRCFFILFFYSVLFFTLSRFIFRRIFYSTCAVSLDYLSEDLRHFQGEITVSAPIWIKKHWRLELEFNAAIENIHSFAVNLERDSGWPSKTNFILTPKAFNKNIWPNTPLRIAVDGIIENNEDGEHAHGLDVYAMLDTERRNSRGGDSKEKLEKYLTAKVFLFNGEDNIIYNERDDAIGCESTQVLNSVIKSKEVDRTQTNDMIVPIKHRETEPVHKVPIFQLLYLQLLH